MKKAHRLQRSQPDQCRRLKHDHRNHELKDAVDKNSQCKPRQFGFAPLARHSPQQPEQHQRRERAQPLVPCPLAKLEVALCRNRLAPYRVRRIEHPGQRRSQRHLRPLPHLECAASAPQCPHPCAHRLQHRHAQDEAERDPQRRHDRVQRKRHQQQRHSLPVPARHDPRHRNQNQSGRKAPGMQILVHQAQRRPRHRQRQHSRHQRHPGPLRSRLRKQVPRDAQASP